MATIDNIRNIIIDDTNKVKLTEEQILMLQMSEEDIKIGHLIDQKQLDKDDLRWLNSYSCQAT